MACYIKCAIYNKSHKYLKYIIMAAFFAFLTNFTFGYTYDDNMNLFKLIHTDNQKKLSNHIIFHYIIRFLSIFIISLILYYKERRAFKREPKKNSEENKVKESSAVVLIYKDIKKDLNMNTNISIISLFTIIIIMVLQRIFEDLFYRSYLRELMCWMFELPLISYLNYKILNFKIHRHHYLVIFINIIFGLIDKVAFLIIRINSKDSKDENNHFNTYYQYNNHKWYIPIGFGFYFVYMVPRVYAISKIKVLMDLKYFSPYKILIFYGFLGSLISAIIGTVSTFIKCSDNFINMNICKIKDSNKKTYLENFSLYFDNFEGLKDIKNISIELFIIFFGIITNYFYVFFYILIIKYLTPMHIIFLNLIYTVFLSFVGSIYNGLWDINDNDTNKSKINVLFFLDILIRIIVFFSLLVYLEFLVLNFCNFNYNLKESIIERSIKEYEKDKNSQIKEKDENKMEEEESLSISYNRDSSEL